MRVVVAGGTGLVGRTVVATLARAGHEAISASPRSGVDAATGAGLASALAGADVLVDVTNARVFDDAGVLNFFTASTRNLVEAAAAAGVRHHVVLSVVGADRIPDSGYLRAKVAQETLVAEAPTPFSILRAGQFFEFLPAIADMATVGPEVRLPPVDFQPAAADDVARAVADVATTAPRNAIGEIAGPERWRLDLLVGEDLRRRGDPRPVVSDPTALYFGGRPTRTALLPAATTAYASTTFAAWAAARKPAS